MTAAVALLASQASAEVLATEQQALKIVLPKAQEIAVEEKSLVSSQREKLQNETHLRFPEKHYRFFIGRNKDGVAGYALIMNEIGKHEYITSMVGISPQFQVTDVVVMEYRESRGGEVKEKRFLSQFHGKKESDPLQINRDVVNYTGATLSSQAIARGVKKALLLTNLFYGRGGQ
jgi:Na+-translocating ferredoxin:NAD+ oxidoreductase RnfG subunit